MSGGYTSSNDDQSPPNACLPLAVPVPAWNANAFLVTLPLATPSATLPLVSIPKPPQIGASGAPPPPPSTAAPAAVRPSRRREVTNSTAASNAAAQYLRSPRTASSYREMHSTILQTSPFFQPCVGAAVRLDPAACDSEWWWIDTLGLEALDAVSYIARRGYMGRVVRESGEMAVVVQFRLPALPPDETAISDSMTTATTEAATSGNSSAQHLRKTSIWSLSPVRVPGMISPRAVSPAPAMGESAGGPFSGTLSPSAAPLPTYLNSYSRYGQASPFSKGLQPLGASAPQLPLLASDYSGMENNNNNNNSNNMDMTQASASAVLLPAVKRGSLLSVSPPSTASQATASMAEGTPMQLPRPLEQVCGMSSQLSDAVTPTTRLPLIPLSEQQSQPTTTTTTATAVTAASMHRNRLNSLSTNTSNNNNSNSNNNNNGMPFRSNSLKTGILSVASGGGGGEERAIITLTLPKTCCITALQGIIESTGNRQLYRRMEQSILAHDYGTTLEKTEEIIKTCEHRFSDPGAIVLLKSFRCRLMFHINRVEEALRAAHHTIQLDPTRIECYSTAVASYLALGRSDAARDLAITCWKKSHIISPSFVNVERLLQVIEASLYWGGGKGLPASSDSHIGKRKGAARWHVELLPAESPVQKTLPLGGNSLTSRPPSAMDSKYDPLLRRLTVLQHVLAFPKPSTFIHSVICRPLLDCPRVPQQLPPTPQEEEINPQSSDDAVVPFPDFAVPPVTTPPPVPIPPKLAAVTNSVGYFGAAPMSYYSRRLRLYTTKSAQIGDLLFEEPVSMIFPLFPQKWCVPRNKGSSRGGSSCCCEHCGEVGRREDSNKPADGIVCAGGCGSWYCSDECRQIAFTEYHCVWCTGSPSAPQYKDPTLEDIRRAFRTFQQSVETSLIADRASDAETVAADCLPQWRPMPEQADSCWQPFVDITALQFLERVIARIVAFASFARYRAAVLDGVQSFTTTPAADAMRHEIEDEVASGKIARPRSRADPHGLHVAEEFLQRMSIPFMADTNLSYPSTVWEAQRTLPPPPPVPPQCVRASPRNATLKLADTTATVACSGSNPPTSTYATVVFIIHTLMQSVHGAVQEGFKSATLIDHQDAEGRASCESLALLLTFLGSTRFADQLWDMCRTSFIVLPQQLQRTATPSPSSTVTAAALPMVALSPLSSTVTDLHDFASKQDVYSRFCQEYIIAKDLHAVVHGADASGSFLSLNSITGAGVSMMSERGNAASVAMLGVLENTPSAVVVSNAEAVMRQRGMVSVVATRSIRPGGVVCAGSRPLLEWIQQSTVESKERKV